ncbi:MAG TPA: response regulator, partial [Opitutus sp.]|nr:response regulator [Opitutus sp.]
RVEQLAIVQNEELREANKAKDRFLASINHEIRNPLNGIIGIAQMLLARNADPRSAYLLAVLQACTEQLRSSMDEVLDFTQIESDRVRLIESDVNLEELVRTTCSSCDIEGRDISFSTAGSAHNFVRCDAGKIRQILSNYLANALKYGEPKGATVELWIDSAEAVSRINLSVTSTGPALSQQEMDALFTALVRGRRARETNAHGTGLGLALCKKLATAMGGTVGVESAAGKTTFWLKASFPTVHGFSLRTEKPSRQHADKRVLAVEDEPYNRIVLEHLLKHFGISSIWAGSGEMALAIAGSHRFDAILMDWLLPDMDGAELLKKLRNIREEPLPPVIVISAYSTTSKRAECLAAGAVAFVSKPIDLAKLGLALDACKLGSLQT